MKCERCGGNLLRDSVGERYCAACGYRPPTDWTLKGLTRKSVRRIVGQTMRDILNDLRSNDPVRRAEGEAFFTSPMFPLFARYFQTTPKRLERWMREEVKENPKADKRDLAQMDTS